MLHRVDGYFTSFVVIVVKYLVIYNEFCHMSYVICKEGKNHILQNYITIVKIFCNYRKSGKIQC